jgi:hypothetical protein
MTGSIKLVGGWLLAAVVAVAFSWGAVAQVRNRVIQPSIEIPPTQVAATGPTTTTSTADPTVIRVEPEVVAAEPEDSDTPGMTTTQPQSTTTSMTPTTAATTATAAPTTTTTTTTTTTAPPQTTTTTTAAPIQTSSYQLTGGVVTISYSPGVVSFVSAIPQPGFGTDARETGPERVRIRFESDTHTSDFRAEWEGSELKITQNETGGDD